MQSRTETWLVFLLLAGTPFIAQILAAAFASTLGWSILQKPELMFIAIVLSANTIRDLEGAYGPGSKLLRGLSIFWAVVGAFVYFGIRLQELMKRPVDAAALTTMNIIILSSSLLTAAYGVRFLIGFDVSPPPERGPGQTQEGVERKEPR